MDKKTVDHWPTAYVWGIAIWFSIAWFMCKYYPEDASWWQDILLGIWIAVIVIITPIFWIPWPSKSWETKEHKKK